MPSQDPETHAAIESLRRIAEALGQPLETLFLSEDGRKRVEETIALIKAFDTITDRQVRARCIALVKLEAERTRAP